MVGICFGPPILSFGSDLVGTAGCLGAGICGIGRSGPCGIGGGCIGPVPAVPVRGPGPPPEPP